MSPRVRSGEDVFLAMTVLNTGFLLDRLGQDCHPLQFLRELTQNSIEAVKRTGEPGEVIWDVDWVTYDLEKRWKLSITDTGDGMSGDEMVRYINQLSSSVAAQSIHGNYGVGAKIAAATRNTHGVLYLSWKNAEGSMIHLCRDSSSGQYGLRQWRRADGSYGHFMPMEDDVRPESIQRHGTKVVLLGTFEDDNTMRAPAGAASPSRWISKYLNSRYYRFPDDVTVRAREGWEYPRADADRNNLRTLTGQKSYLDRHSAASGTVHLTGAQAHWWILKDEDAISNNSGHVESAGHVAALYRDELYEHATGRSGVGRLQQFGATFGYRYVVIYVEPTEDGTNALTTNTARTLLLINNQPLPWSDWAAEFREKLPSEIEDLVREKASASTETDHSKTIRDRLKDLLRLFKLSRYRPSPTGSLLIDEQILDRGGRPRTQETDRSPRGGTSTGAGGGTDGNIYAVFEKKDGIPGRRITPDPFPVVKWVSVRDGTREVGVIEDRAAQFLPDQNLLLINGDFRAFSDLTAFFVQEFGSVAGVEPLAREAVHAWCEQALVEAVIGIQALMHSKEWSAEDIERARSEEALTAVVMQRYHVHFAVKRELGSRLGALRSKA